MKRICIVNNDFSVVQLYESVLESILSFSGTKFEERIEKFLNVKYCYLTSCGLTGLYIILKSLKKLYPEKSEVIIPAYTAPALILPVYQLGLKLKLCDISLETLNLDIKQLSNIVTGKTLAIVSVNSFGIPVNLDQIYNTISENKTFVIKDIAQSLGSKINSQVNSEMLEIGFGSFGRGKNFSLYSGGYIISNSEILKNVIEENYKKLPAENFIFQIQNITKFVLFSFLIEPHIYYFMSGLISIYRKQKLQTKYRIYKMGEIRKIFSSEMFKTWLQEHKKRINNGLYLYHRLKNFDAILLPYYSEEMKINFCRFPVIFKNRLLKYKVHYQLKKYNIESSFMYEKPVHHWYQLGYRKEEFPNANYLSEHLLTLPVHGYTTKCDLDKIIEVFYRL